MFFWGGWAIAPVTTGALDYPWDILKEMRNVPLGFDAGPLYHTWQAQSLATQAASRLRGRKSPRSGCGAVAWFWVPARVHESSQLVLWDFPLPEMAGGQLGGRFGGGAAMTQSPVGTVATWT